MLLFQWNVDVQICLKYDAKPVEIKMGITQDFLNAVDECLLESGGP